MGALLMIHTKTHVLVDGVMHKIARVEAHADGPAHTHRAHLGCGTTIDIDVGGVKAQARSLERLGHVMAEKDPAVRDHHAAIHRQAADMAASKAEPLDGGRWHIGAKAKGCAACEAHEAGADPVVPPLSHTPARTVEADTDTGIACPKCGSKVYKRRLGGQLACTGQGHEFTSAELMDHARTGFERLTKLVVEE